MKRTISAEVGKGSVNHNSRKFRAENVDGSRTHLNIDYCNKRIQTVYHQLFDEALKRYNEKQTRADRRIPNYYEKIRSGNQEKPFHEIILQIGNKEDMSATGEYADLARTVLDEYYRGFQERNPNLRVFSAHLHMDEATPHIHIDFVPFTTGSKRGLDTRVSLKQALAAQGFKGGTRGATEWAQWVQSEKEQLAAVMELGGMDSADPCDPAVAKWWADKAQEVWANLPGLGGFLVKADSEGRPGPFTYGRNQADGANMLADAVAPCGGHIVWRCFVYNCQQDWRNTKIDRARAGYDYFMPLDGTFRDNVTLQIKNGPMDFQVREPVSPLIGGLQHTHIAVEFQIAQEYTGQQRHVCYLMPWFRQILDFDMHTRPNGDAHVRALIQGAGNGMVAVTNTGNDENWTGHDLAAANLYGFGRLSYDTTDRKSVV